MWKPISNTAGLTEKIKSPFGGFFYLSIFTCLKVRLILGKTSFAVFGT
jgi:hypothetical protein